MITPNHHVHQGVKTPSTPAHQRMSLLGETRAPTTNKDDRDASFLTRLQTSLREEGAELERLEQSLTLTLSIARSLSAEHVPAANRTDWDRDWSELQAAIQTIQHATADVRRCALTARAAGAVLAESYWKAQPRRLADLFGPLREMGARALSSEEFDHLAELLILLKAQVACCRAHVHSMEIQLGLQQRYQANHPSLEHGEIQAHGPRNGSIVEAEEFGDEYRQAENELRQEQDQPGGGLEILKALFMYVEAPEERVLKKRVSEFEQRRAAGRGC